MNPISWFELPVAEMGRAVDFYSAVFGWELKVMEGEALTMCWFPSDDNAYGAGGSLVLSEHYVPHNDGLLVYFMCDDVQETLARIPSAGGKILKEKTLITPDIGYMGLALDTEGNRIALHSMK